MKQYDLFDSIASGGMGTVCFARARDGAGLSRVVAVKRMHGELADNPTCLAMFHEELRLSARVRHPNVIATLDMVEQHDELLLVMEYVPGESLQDLIARTNRLGQRVPPAIAVSIVCGILQGLQAVHDATNEAGEPLGIVHRDVSPENILVGRDGIARLLDFGIARGAGRKYETRVGEIKGKPSYLAPEQILNGGKIVDRRTDVYGASLVLWEALTGLRLFDGESPTVTLSRVLTEEVPRPSSVVSALPQELDEIILRGLSREPGQRFATALEMARALRNACGSLLPFEVAEWLQQAAGDSLAIQAAQVARIETLSSEPPEEEEAAPESVRTSMSLTPPRSTPLPPLALERALTWLDRSPPVRAGVLALGSLLHGHWPDERGRSRIAGRLRAGRGGYDSGTNSACSRDFGGAAERICGRTCGSFVERKTHEEGATADACAVRRRRRLLKGTRGAPPTPTRSAQHDAEPAHPEADAIDPRAGGAEQAATDRTFRRFGFGEPGGAVGHAAADG
jgi:serine/threonine protein kinase